MRSGARSRCRKDEVEGLRTLRGQDLVSTQRITDAEMRMAQLDGQLGQIIASIAQTGAEIAGAELQIIQVDQDVRSEASKQLAETTTRLNELFERKIAADDQVKKQTIVAPITGTVYQLAAHTVGGVVNPGRRDHADRARRTTCSSSRRRSARPRSIASMPTRRPCSASPPSARATTPEYIGAVDTVSPDLITDQRTGMSYYKARIEMPKEAIDELGDKFVPGMPVEVFIVTGDRTVLSYLTKPLTDQIMHTFRER